MIGGAVGGLMEVLIGTIIALVVLQGIKVGIAKFKSNRDAKRRRAQFKVVSSLVDDLEKNRRG
jgi:hypothetical protein